MKIWHNLSWTFDRNTCLCFAEVYAGLNYLDNLNILMLVIIRHNRTSLIVWYCDRIRMMVAV